MYTICISVLTRLKGKRDCANRHDVSVILKGDTSKQRSNYVVIIHILAITKYYTVDFINECFFLFIGHCCAMFDIGIGRVIEDYSRPCSECPFIYKSTMSFLCMKNSFSLPSFTFIHLYENFLKHIQIEIIFKLTLQLRM